LAALAVLGACPGCTVEGGAYASPPNGAYEASAIGNAGPVGNAGVEYPNGEPGVEVDAEADSAFSEPPPLVEIDGGVSVVEDASYPEYYSGGVYWSYRDGVWYRANDYYAPWVIVDMSFVPVIVSHRDHHHFEHYHHQDRDRVWHEERAEHHEGERRGRDGREHTQGNVEQRRPEGRPAEAAPPRPAEPRVEERRAEPRREEAPRRVEPSRPNPAAEPRREAPRPAQRIAPPRPAPIVAPQPPKRQPAPPAKRGSSKGPARR